MVSGVVYSHLILSDSYGLLYSSFFGQSLQKVLFFMSLLSFNRAMKQNVKYMQYESNNVV